ncbi:hypothetical protein HS125_15710 [bacterium]|nr:hypothetical protein [bacterium]
MNHAVRDNVFNDCESAVRLSTGIRRMFRPGRQSEITLTNNLIYYANHGLLPRGTSGGYETPAIYVALQQNTMDNIDYGALTLDGDSDMTYVYATARNNVFTSCYDGYADPCTEIEQHFHGWWIGPDYTPDSLGSTSVRDRILSLPLRGLDESIRAPMTRRIGRRPV